MSAAAADAAAVARFTGEYVRTAGHAPYVKKVDERMFRKAAPVAAHEDPFAGTALLPAAATFTSFDEFKQSRLRNVPPKFGAW
jgi:hypothetical protein